MRIGYLIIAHHLPDHLVRLVARLDHPDVVFLIHFDAAAPDATFQAALESLGRRRNVRFVPRHRCYWAGAGVVHGTLECLRAAVAAQPMVDYVFLLSGQDYPLMAHAGVVETVEQNQRRLQMKLFALPDPRWVRGQGGWHGGGLERFEVWYTRCGGRTIPLPYDPRAEDGLALKWSRLMKRIAPKRRFPGGIMPYGGVANWGMPIECAGDMIDFVERRPDYLRFFRYVFAPDEMFFQTIVGNCRWHSMIAAQHSHFTKWRPGVSSLLDRALVDEALATGRPFARKFDPAVNSELIAYLDHHIDRQRAARADGRPFAAPLPQGPLP